MVPQLTIEDLQKAIAPRRLEALRTVSEDQWFDRKSARTGARQLAETIIAFANAEGGLVVVGIHDGKIEGIAGAGDRINAWRQAGIDFAEPPVAHQVARLTCKNARGEQDELVLIEVEPSEHVHTDRKGGTFLRVGDENRKLGVVQAQELRFDKGQSVFDGTASDATMDDLDGSLIERYRKKIGASGGPTALQARGLVVTKGRVERPTVAGLLLLGEYPQQFLPQTEVRVLVHGGTSRETGPRSNVLEDRTFGGPLPAQVDAARRLIRRMLPSAIRLGGSGLFAKETLIPEFAWAEAVVNAVIHRSYSYGGDHIRVELFPDRLEVESPGRLPGLVRTETIRTTHFARNPRIARGMRDLGYGRELGEGVDRMYREMENVGLPDPLYSELPASVRVVLLADPLTGQILRKLPPRSDRFAEYLVREGRVTTSEAIDLFDVTRPTALGYLHRLEEAGLIEHVGTGPKDPRGYWRLTRGDGSRR